MFGLAVFDDVYNDCDVVMVGVGNDGNNMEGVKTCRVSLL
jgi:hypothetical protein